MLHFCIPASIGIVRTRNCHLLFIGAYTPLKNEGTIVVDGVLASCHASINHDLAHIGMAPIRWFPKLMDLIFGEENGSTAYVYVATGIGRLAMFY